MKIRIILFVLLLSSITMQAQNSKYQLVGGVYNAMTKTPMVDVKVTLMLQDSSVVDSASTIIEEVNMIPNSSLFILPVKSGDYLLKFSYPGYETQTIKLNVKNKRSQFQILNFIYLKPQQKVRMLE